MQEMSSLVPDLFLFFKKASYLISLYEVKANGQLTFDSPQLGKQL